MKHLEGSSFITCFLLSNLSIQARRKQEKQNIPTTISLAKRHQLSQQLLDKQKNEIQKLKQKTDKVMLSSALTCIFVIMLQTSPRNFTLCCCFRTSTAHRLHQRATGPFAHSFAVSPDQAKALIARSPAQDAEEEKETFIAMERIIFKQAPSRAPCPETGAALTYSNAPSHDLHSYHFHNFERD